MVFSPKSVWTPSRRDAARAFRSLACRSRPIRRLRNILALSLTASPWTRGVPSAAGTAAPIRKPSADHDTARPDIVLFNGGVFESPLLKERLLAVMSGWFNQGRAGHPRPRKTACPRPRPLWQTERKAGNRSFWTTTGSIWPSPAARRITAWSAAGRACGSPPDLRARITSAWKTSSPRPPEPLSQRERAVWPFASCLPRPSRGRISN